MYRYTTISFVVLALLVILFNDNLDGEFSSTIVCKTNSS